MTLKWPLQPDSSHCSLTAQVSACLCFILTLCSNYGPTIAVQNEAVKRGCQQVLWLYGEQEEITEVGTMNLFTYWTNEQGGQTLQSYNSNIQYAPGVFCHLQRKMWALGMCILPFFLYTFKRILFTSFKRLIIHDVISINRVAFNVRICGLHMIRILRFAHRQVGRREQAQWRLEASRRC